MTVLKKISSDNSVWIPLEVYFLFKEKFKDTELSFESWVNECIKEKLDRENRTRD